MNLPPFKLERYFAKYEFHVQYVLGASDCESLSVLDLLDLESGAKDSFQELWLGYTESEGAPSLRREIARLYSTIQPDQILVHCGAEEAIFLFMHAMLQPGDHVVVHSPCYQSLVEVARGIGCDVSLWRASEREGWALDLTDLRASLRPNTRAVVVNMPHNPTGYLMTPDEFSELNRLTRERGIALFSDEVYRESEYDVADRLPPACDINENAISLGVMSKTYGLPGLRIGWIATHNAEIRMRMAGLKDYTTICSSAPSEFLAELALRHRQQIVKRNLDLIARNLTVLDGFFAKHADRFFWRRPKAGPIAFPRLVGDDIEAFCHELATTAGVLLLPGTIFDDRENHFRIGFGRKNLPEAILRLEDFLISRRS